MSGRIGSSGTGTPNHVGGLLIFQLPDGAPRDFLRRLMHDFRTYRGFTAPWNRRLQLPINIRLRIHGRG